MIPRRLAAPLLPIFSLLLWVLLSAAVHAQSDDPVAPGDIVWYVPAHEIPDRTVFHSGPSFGSLPVSIPNRTQPVKVINVTQGWVQFEMSAGNRAYLHARVVRSLLFDPAAANPRAEFDRASIFREAPERVMAGLSVPSSGGASAPSTTSRGSRPLWTPKKFGRPVLPPREETEGGGTSGGSAIPGVGRGSRSIIGQPTDPVPGTPPDAATEPASR